MKAQDNRQAVEAALAELEDRLTGAELPLVALLRQLAAELDEGGASARVAASYLTCWRTLYKRVGSASGVTTKTAGASLATLRRKHAGRLS